MTNDDYKNITNCLRKYRRARGLRQKEVAMILGLKSSSMISRWEKGITMPSAFNVFRLAALYRIMADALFIDLSRQLKEEILKQEKKVLEANRITSK